MWKLSVFNFENIPYGNTCIDKLLRYAQASGCILTGKGILNWFPWRKTGLFQNPHQPIQQCGDSDLSDETGELCWPAISGPSTQIMYNVCTKINSFWAIYTHKQKYRFLITQRFYWIKLLSRYPVSSWSLNGFCNWVSCSYSKMSEK